MNEPRRRGAPSSLSPRDKFELRQLREAGVSVKEAAAYMNVSVATAMRALAELRQKLGPEKFTKNGQRARSYLTHRTIQSA
jgi:DNA-directed RNA polymerase specialized sigma24 family protein